MQVAHPQPHPPIGHLEPEDERKLGAPLKDFLRRWIRIPDADVKWAKLVVQHVLTNAPFKPDWIFTSAPPESLFLAGAKLKQAFGAKWACDFRDHWFEQPHFSLRETKFRQFIEKAWLAQYRSHLDMGIAVNDLIAQEYSNLFGTSILTIPHFTVSKPVIRPALNDDHKHIVHVGRFSLSDPNCQIDDLLNCFESVAKSAPHLRLHLVGALSAEEISKVEASCMRKQIIRVGVVPMEQALGYLEVADALALVGASDATAPPSKAVEYAKAGKPTLFFSQAAWVDKMAGADYNPKIELRHIANGKSGGTVLPAPQDHIAAGQQVYDALLAKLPS